MLKGSGEGKMTVELSLLTIVAVSQVAGFTILEELARLR